MSITSACNVASICESIDPEWHKEPFEPSEIKARLDKLVDKTIHCGALFFKEVRFLETRQRVQKAPVCIANNSLCKSALKRHFGLSDTSFYSLSQPELDFYLLFQNKVYRVNMSSQNNTVVGMPKPETPYIWTTSSAKLREMAKKDWSNSFVTASNYWNKVIPLD